MRLLALIAYDGSKFFGSQKQSQTSETVLGYFERALGSLGIFSQPIASGRTDRGVHALRQPVAFDIPLFWVERLHSREEIYFFVAHLNQKLAPFIVVTKLYRVPEEFHPRYDAIARTYRYIISRRKPLPFLAEYVTYASVTDSDIRRLQSLIRMFEGEHDFRFFMKTGSDDNGTVRHIFSATCLIHHGYIVLSFCANGFLRSQVRLMCAGLLAANGGIVGEHELLSQLACKEKYITHPAVPNGLYLSKVSYAQPFSQLIF